MSPFLELLIRVFVWIPILSTFVQSGPLTRRTSLTEAETSFQVLHDEWFNATTGLWSNNWWQSANQLTTIAHLAAISNTTRASINSDIRTVALNAPKSGVAGQVGWLNGFYDDEGWWALAWIAVFDLTNDATYLNFAKGIFDDMVLAWETDAKLNRCGGLWWDKDKTYVAAIANELFLSVAAHLANRDAERSRYYLDWALYEWDWFEKRSGLINSDNLINDGISLTNCENNGQTTFTYNQGVILGALVELDKASPNPNHLEEANKIALAALDKLTDVDGILDEPTSDNPDITASQFKGVFVRNLRFLHQASPHKEYRDFLQKNANSIWTIARDPSSQQLGPNWQGPYAVPTAPSHGSALDSTLR